MAPCNNYLEIHVHLEDGRTVRFSQNDPATADALLRHIPPSRLFAQPQLVLRDEQALTLLPSATIVRIDLIADQMPDWPFYHGVQCVQEISRDEFLARCHSVPHSPVGTVETDYTEIETVSGQLIYLQLEVRREPSLAIDRHILLQQILALGGLHWKRREKGASILHTTKIARLSMYPGPPAPAGAWPATRILE